MIMSKKIDIYQIVSTDKQYWDDIERLGMIGTLKECNEVLKQLRKDVPREKHYKEWIGEEEIEE